MRRLGLDGNPLRRRPDKIAACLAALLVAVFLIGARLLSAAAVGWVGRAGKPARRLRRFLRRTKTGLLRIDHTAIALEAHLDGKWLLAPPTSP